MKFEGEKQEFVPSIYIPVSPELLEPSIYRVPKQLRKVNKEAYTPKLVSIGPFHHGRKELGNMKKHKKGYLKDFCSRTGKRQEDLRKIIEDNKDKIRRCYPKEDLTPINTNFVEMILWDAIFIIELFLKVEDRKIKENEKEDYILSKPWLLNGIFYDLILLENQLPIFILEDLFKSAFNDSSSPSHQQGDLNKEDTPFLKLSRSFFSRYDSDKQQASNIDREVKHFTDLLRYFFCPLDLLRCFFYPLVLEPTKDKYSICSATKLDKAGLQFKPDEDNRRLLDIKFPENECLTDCPCFNLSWLLACLPCLKCFPCLEYMERFLEVPCFKVDDRTECLFRNLMALEQCRYPSNSYVCNYVMLMKYLINTEKDVALLVDKKVIINQLGSKNRVAELINNLCKEIVVVRSCYSDLAEELNEYRENPWNRNMAYMTRVYFRNFRRGTATVVGLIFLVLAIWKFFKKN